MSKKVSPAGSQKVNMPPQPPKTGITKPAPNDWLRYAPYLLLIAVVAVYANTLSFEFTELDDSIFIREFTAYNEDLANLLTSFTRGVFNATTDPYYRPLFLDSIILNYQMYNTDIAGYHAFNLIFHAIAVVLLHKLLLKMKVIPLHSFWLALLFAIHPVLCQAVAWIPGRNDTMLAIFTFAYIINAINYANEEAKVPLLALGLALLFLLLAFFTKETAVFAPPVAFVLILMGLGQSWNSNRMYALYGSAVVAFTIWYIARHNATIAVTPIKPMEMLTSFVGRLGLIIQYLGKIVCPANLSVFPIQQDTTYFIGIPAIALLIALAYMNKDR
ncbi:MAG: hypothetical protein EBX41_09830, partial [Chitinophagia bacterium]|nr:hypothetical protein [Chitinophagia bacterium]